jgi:hypothetical protein
MLIASDMHFVHAMPAIVAFDEYARRAHTTSLDAVFRPLIAG